MPRDPSDTRFLDCVRAADADSLVTGDEDFADVRGQIRASILSVREFKRVMVDASVEIK